MSNINRMFAIYYAGQQHQFQKYGQESYFKHLFDVDQELAIAGYDENSYERILGWIHDVAEDTKLESESVFCEQEQIFGKIIADASRAITNEPGKNRKEVFLATYIKYLDNKIAYAVKIADRNCNMRASLTNLRKAKMYGKEADFFQEHMFYHSNQEWYLDIRIHTLTQRFLNLKNQLKELNYA